MKQDKITISHGGKYGSIAFDPVNKSVAIVLEDSAVKSIILNYLQKEHIINTPDQSATKFSNKKYYAFDSLDSFNVVMSRMWENTGVHVDWSIPSDTIDFLNSQT